MNNRTITEEDSWRYDDHEKSEMRRIGFEFEPGRMQQFVEDNVGLPTRTLRQKLVETTDPDEVEAIKRALRVDSGV
jgi:hypothetical protein